MLSSRMARGRLVIANCRDRAASREVRQLQQVAAWCDA